MDNIEELKSQLTHKEQEVQQAMDNYVQLDLQRVKEYNELVDLYKAKQQELKELQETIDDFITDNNSLYSDDGKQPSNLDELQECMQSSMNEFVKYKQIISEIKEIINDFTKQDILTFPDLKPKENYKLIQKQCGEPIIQILQKISECEMEI